MPWIAAAAVIGGSLIQANSAKKAASAQSASADAAARAQLEQYYQTREDMQPWRDVGGQSIRTIGDLLGVSQSNFSLNDNNVPIADPVRYSSDPAYRAAWDEVKALHDASYSTGYDSSSDRSWIEGELARRGVKPSQGSGELLRDFTLGDFEKDPGYQFRLQEGNKALENAARARGTSLSPMTVKGLMRYGQDFASNEFTNAYNRNLTNRTTKFNMLSGAAGSGQMANNTVANAGANATMNAGNFQVGGANARGAAGIAGANAISGGINTMGNFYQQQQNRDMQNEWLNRMFPQQQAPNSGMWWGNQ